MPQTTTDIALPTRPVALFGVAVTGVLACAALGALTNSVNAWISPLYFINILGLGGDNVWHAGVAHGVFEGGAFGFLFSLVFAIGVAVITGVTCTYRFAARHLVGMLVCASVFWVLGGICAMILAAIFPDAYRATFIGVPEELGPMLAYAWVGGSIWGIEGGGFIALVIGLFVLRANWDRRAILSEPVD